MSKIQTRSILFFCLALVFLLSSCHHFLQAAVGRAAHDGVRVDVK